MKIVKLLKEIGIKRFLRASLPSIVVGVLVALTDSPEFIIGFLLGMAYAIFRFVIFPPEN